MNLEEQLCIQILSRDLFDTKYMRIKQDKHKDLR